MYYIFYSTNDVFKGEEILRDNNIDYKIVPTPIKDSVYCGVCLFSDVSIDTIQNLLDSNESGDGPLTHKYIIMG
ncbi:DUF3343 domain-containing protein [Anaerosalibacter sp. Marseille-P3206]|uniref:DUF3343 domain-containing protein n=1 Tax=Anaerosalibacter sp. Marseille-P3206 TaxID=1871005 RepID=UPI000984CF06|nr:DUF3343 domain-containing protein [Anaerosalibacter sp. Marseille-P3206]